MCTTGLKPVVNKLFSWFIPVMSSNSLPSDKWDKLHAQFMEMCESYKKEDAKDSKAIIREIVEQCVTWCWASGIVMLKNPPSISSARVVPLSLVPTQVDCCFEKYVVFFQINKKVFDLAVRLCPVFTELVAQISLNPQWIFDSLEKFVKTWPQKLAR